MKWGPDEVIQFGEPKRHRMFLPTERLHLAMGNGWIAGNGERQDLSVAQLRPWLSGLVSHIATELKYAQERGLLRLGG